MKRKKASYMFASYSITILVLLYIVNNITYSRRDHTYQKQLNHKEIMNHQLENTEVVQGVTKTGSSMLKASSLEGPTELTTAKTYDMISILDYEDDWILGKIDDTFLSLNNFVAIESYNYRVSINDKLYRMIVNKYDEDYENLGYEDLCNGDIFYIDESVKYVTITIYKYENRKVIKHYNQEILSHIKKGLKFNITKIEDLGKHLTDKELLTAQVHMESLSNYSNYRSGWYKSWGGEYAPLSDKLCTRNLYQVDDKPYVINTNDSRIAISISEFNAQGKWLKYNETLLNGDTFKKQPTTAYIGITIRSIKWGVELETLFQYGLKIDFASSYYMDKTATISMSKADFSNPNRWIPGSYLPETGKFVIDPNKICFESFCTVDDEEYMVDLPGGYLRMSILELDKSEKVLLSHELQSGQKFKKLKNTEKIAITVYGSGKTFSVAEYKKMMKEYSKFGIEKYMKYAHNTQMKNLLAGELIHKINVGWNLGNSLDSKSTTSSQTANLKQELNWGNPYITKDLIDYVAKSGFNTIRIPVTWNYNTYRDGKGALKVSREWLNRVQEVVDYGIANDLYVILNTHHEQPLIYAGTDDVTMKKVSEDAKALWTEIAEHFKTYDEHLIFESYNEVDNIEKSWNYSDKAAAQMNVLNQIFVDTVRNTGDNNANRILMVPTLLDGADSRFYTGFQMPKDTVANKIIVQVHSYSKKFNQDIESDFAQLLEFSNRIKAPIIIGEFGTTPSYPLPELREEQAANFVARAAKYGIICIWWDNGSDYKIIDRRDLSNSNLDLVSALLEGSQGIGYEVKQGLLFNNLNQFAYLTPNMKTGELVNTYWGTLTTDHKGIAYPIQEGTHCTISLKATNDAASVWLQRLLFYNATGSLAQAGKEIQSQYYVGALPENAASIRVSINSPTINITQANYQKYLANGEIELVIRFFKVSDVKKINIPSMPYK